MPTNPTSATPNAVPSAPTGASSTPQGNPSTLSDSLTGSSAAGSSLSDKLGSTFGSAQQLYSALPQEGRQHLYFLLIALAIFVGMLLVSKFNLFLAYAAMSTYAGYLMMSSFSWYVRYVNFMNRVTYYPLRFMFGETAVNLVYGKVMLPLLTHFTYACAGLLVGLFTSPLYIVYRAYKLYKAKEQLPVSH